MKNMLNNSTCQLFGTDYKDVIAMVGELRAWPKFSIELEEIQNLKRRFEDFTPSIDDETAYFLPRNAKSFHMNICFIGSFILILLSRLS